ncbi:MAG TPA: DUF427 domain-containing protein [Gaiellaceae bacterium]|nr:DUF427 domain-containing protein [Gaiellaceae bacterium]
MSLTANSGPFGKKPAGTFNFEVETPTGAVLYWDPVPQRIRATFGGETVVDSMDARLLHESTLLPVYYFPERDVRMDLLTPSERTSHCPHKGDAVYWSLEVGRRKAPDAAWAYPTPIEHAPFLGGHLAFYWSALDQWFAEDEPLYGHPRDPYVRIDVYRLSRRVRALLDSEVLADSVRVKALYETSLRTRYYFPPEDVRLDLLEPSTTVTRCAYKGTASHFNALGHDDIAWIYSNPQHDAEPIRDYIAFYDERVEIETS